MPIRVLIVDDHTMVRQGLRMFLEMHAELAIVREAADGAAAVEKAHALQPDVVLMDLLLPVMDQEGALRVAEQLRRRIEELALPHPRGGVVTMPPFVATTASCPRASSQSPSTVSDTPMP